MRLTARQGCPTAPLQQVLEGGSSQHSTQEWSHFPLIYFLLNYRGSYCWMAGDFDGLLVNLLLALEHEGWGRGPQTSHRKHNGVVIGHCLECLELLITFKLSSGTPAVWRHLLHALSSCPQYHSCLGGLGEQAADWRWTVSIKTRFEAQDIAQCNNFGRWCTLERQLVEGLSPQEGINVLLRGQTSHQGDGLFWSESCRGWRVGSETLPDDLALVPSTHRGVALVSENLSPLPASVSAAHMWHTDLHVGKTTIHILKTWSELDTYQPETEQPESHTRSQAEAGAALLDARPIT